MNLSSPLTVPYNRRTFYYMALFVTLITWKDPDTVSMMLLNEQRLMKTTTQKTITGL